jgi:membrane associated rhomboid family serine protease
MAAAATNVSSPESGRVAMTDFNMDLREAVLTWCKEATPNPWYPSLFCQASGVPREQLDPALEELRLGGLVRLTDWVPNQGQGYTLTPAGEEFVNDPRLLGKLRSGAVVRPAAAPPPLAPAARPDTTTWDRGEQARAALLSRTPAYVTGALIFANVMVFLFGYYLAQRDKVRLEDFLYGAATPAMAKIHHDSGAISRFDIAPRQEWWRLLTACFVHIGLLHLAVNMYSLYLLGGLLERLWGSGRLLALYLIAGFGGNCAVVALVKNPYVLTAGASGAIWGLMASMVAWIWLNRHAFDPFLRARWLRQLGFLVLLNIFITFAIPGISKEAHFGGGITGLVVSVPLNYLYFGPLWKRGLALAGVAAVPVLALGLVLFFLRSDLRKTEQQSDQRKRGENRQAPHQKEPRDKVTEAGLRSLSTAFSANREARKGYEAVGKTLLDKGPKQRRRDSATVARGIQWANKVLALLEKADRQLKKAPKVRADHRLAAPLQAARDSVSSWKIFYKNFRSSLGHDDWDREEKDDLQHALKEALRNEKRFSELVGVK